jgi:hypothetical protein
MPPRSPITVPPRSALTGLAAAVAALEDGCASETYQCSSSDDEKVGVARRGDDDDGDDDDDDDSSMDSDFGRPTGSDDDDDDEDSDEDDDVEMGDDAAPNPSSLVGPPVGVAIGAVAPLVGPVAAPRVAGVSGHPLVAGAGEPPVAMAWQNGVVNPNARAESVLELQHSVDAVTNLPPQAREALLGNARQCVTRADGVAHNAHLQQQPVLPAEIPGRVGRAGSMMRRAVLAHDSVKTQIVAPVRVNFHGVRGYVLGFGRLNSTTKNLDDHWCLAARLYETKHNGVCWAAAFIIASVEWGQSVEAARDTADRQLLNKVAKSHGVCASQVPFVFPN